MGTSSHKLGNDVFEDVSEKNETERAVVVMMTKMMTTAIPKMTSNGKRKSINEKRVKNPLLKNLHLEMTKRLAASNHDNNAIPTLGKYGILRVSDYHSKQRTFTVWLDEVESVMSFTGPKWELQNYFSFCR